MIWIKDHNEIMVNLDRWDFLDYYTIEDKEKNDEIIYLQQIKNMSGINPEFLGEK